MILDQRSDIEQFFLESLEQVKEEKRRKLETQKQEQIQQEQKNYSMGMAQADSISQLASQKVTVELQDLDWEDRERILRLLFSKMNTGQSATDWREKPGSSAREEGSSHMATGVN